MATTKRPTSPHLQIYKWGPHMALSILHRASGVALGGGTLLLAWWLIALSSGPEQYAQFQTCMASIYGKIVLMGFTLALMLHLCNGIRHLFWDMGKGFEVETTARTNILVLLGTIVLTGIAWVIGYGLV
ncbi:succinate dehydrogenase, cytochrome b556 subunit [Paremcibacter congregatus]|uniref:Succinate dehydrogenase cytochrome b556 subunit n=1 Tax=Paremcibacter congregatus TaxID=2043170 RepID=A0A2G4YNV8_9PROT|nr:succinate dehydrogenase, cytochrome b556 subunit [Paremcibacter congregatus]PHZ83987.1 succinate dehydrogenase, cytochrome b556 subunit [Paremcibacter congregatus]QDE25919.1 succinate dehydrogenase, cytochrome b556 subunit [Paremcibacter congregatus]